MFDRVLAVPSYHHAFGKHMAPYDIRVALAEAFVQDMAEPRVQVSDIERTIWTGEPVSSLAVLRALAEQHPDEQPVLILGPDNGARLHEFAHYDQLSSEFSVFILGGQGSHFPRSTEVRRRLAAHEAVAEAVTPSVAALLTTTSHHFAGL